MDSRGDDEADSHRYDHAWENKAFIQILAEPIFVDPLFNLLILCFIPNHGILFATLHDVEHESTATEEPDYEGDK